MDGSKVSIITPCFNRESLIPETLSSVAEQTYSNWECLVVDDGSDDGSIEVIRGFVEKDPRFRLIQREREPKGAPTCRNLGIEHASGKWVLFLDSDDILAPDCLERRMNHHNLSKADVTVFYGVGFRETPGDRGSKTAKRKPTRYPDPADHFLVPGIPWMILHPLWPLDQVKRINGFNEHLKDWQDWDLSFRALCEGVKFDVLYNYTPDCYFRVSDKYQRINSQKDRTTHYRHRVEALLAYYPIFRNSSVWNRQRDIKYKNIIYSLMKAVLKKQAFPIKKLKILPFGKYALLKILSLLRKF